MPADFTPYWEQIVADIRSRSHPDSGHQVTGYRPTNNCGCYYRDTIGARSNVHVRRAIEHLVATGELRSHRGAGVWVADRRRPRLD